MSKKLKIRKSIARRFKITKNGKVLHMSSFSRHLRRHKSKSQLRSYKVPKLLIGEMAKKFKQLLGQ